MNTPLSIQSCPFCQQVIQYRSPDTQILECPSCHQIIWRKPDGELDKVFQVRTWDDQEWIGVGTTGIVDGLNFEVIGSLFVWFEESVFYFHTLILGNGEIGWLGHGYGKYFLYRIESKKKASKGNTLPKTFTNQNIELDEGKEYRMLRKFESHKWEFFGEVLFPTPKGNSFLFLDLANEKGDYYAFALFDNQEFWGMSVQSLSWEELQLKNTASGNRNIREFACASCRESISVHSFPFAQSCACPQCGQTYVLEVDGRFKALKNLLPATNQLIPMGRAGYIEGTRYEVVGYIQKKDNSPYHSKWREYTLYHPVQGYAFLSEYDGHWIFIREAAKHPVLDNGFRSEINYENEPFLLYNSYKAKVVEALGEFPRNVFDNGETSVREFISPPEIWIEEKDKKEGIIWFHGKHISSDKIKSEFNLNHVPYKKGVGAVQPTGYINRYKLLVVTLAITSLLCILYFLTSFSHEKRPIVDDRFTFNDTSWSIYMITDTFQLTRYRGNLVFDIQSPVDNDWVELNATLVNSKTGEEYNLEKGLEFYQGVSGGEAWSEGSRNGRAVITRIPAGTYYLTLAGFRNPDFGTPHYFYLQVTYDLPDSRNLWWSLALLLVWPLVIFFYSNMKERERWSNSPHSPFE